MLILPLLPILNNLCKCTLGTSLLVYKLVSFPSCRMKMLHLYGFHFSHGLEYTKEITKTVEVFCELTVSAANISIE